MIKFKCMVNYCDDDSHATFRIIKKEVIYEDSSRCHSTGGYEGIIGTSGLMVGDLG